MKCDHVCLECGAHEDGSWSWAERDLIPRQLCFSCCHYICWAERAAQPENRHRMFVFVGRCYTIGEPGQRFPGFGGRRFLVNFSDGTIVETSNLWTQGIVPAHLRARMPDSAVLVNDDSRAPRPDSGFYGLPAGTSEKQQ